MNTVADAVPELSRQARDLLAESGEQLDRARREVHERLPDLSKGLTQARRELAGRIDPDPVPRRRPRWLLAGVVVTAVSGVVWTVLSRRPQQVEPQSTSDRPIPATPPGGSRITGGPATSAAGGPAARNGSSGH
ncbi:hypothetical protein ACVGVM_00105 [Pseudonocardia bannensis]|uniref:DUF3618 domain-containing protein n=1 Tax=Pseudonocardia bannensis TaxID=630973 RepID=A0A848DFS0_9PSEU|nr:hypothetical protein [Pseudonocardia bannensis]NMH91502.1 hypothetical protein [Pseudonocardia bannensis]